MRVRVGDAHQESDDAGLHVAEIEVPAAFVARTFVIIAVTAFTEAHPDVVIQRSRRHRLLSRSH